MGALPVQLPCVELGATKTDESRKVAANNKTPDRRAIKNLLPKPGAISRARVWTGRIGQTVVRGNRQLKAFARVRIEFGAIDMNDQGVPPSERLDSWKAIADYLDRDVATVRRWERLHRMPVRRIAGRGRSVFAYVSEIDEWLRAMAPVESTPPAAIPVAM